MSLNHSALTLPSQSLQCISLCIALTTGHFFSSPLNELESGKRWRESLLLDFLFFLGMVEFYLLTLVMMTNNIV